VSERHCIGQLDLEQPAGANEQVRGRPRAQLARGNLFGVDARVHEAREPGELEHRQRPSAARHDRTRQMCPAGEGWSGNGASHGRDFAPTSAASASRSCSVSILSAASRFRRARRSSAGRSCAAAVSARPAASSANCQSSTTVSSGIITWTIARDRDDRIGENYAESVRNLKPPWYS
jgi:hypothetical protein